MTMILVPNKTFHKCLSLLLTTQMFTEQKRLPVSINKSKSSNVSRDVEKESCNTYGGLA